MKFDKSLEYLARAEKIIPVKDTKQEVNLCECGCCQPVIKIGNIFLNGHSHRTEKYWKKLKKLEIGVQPCQCGCGQPTKPGNWFIHGHSRRGQHHTLATRAKLHEINLNLNRNWFICRYCGILFEGNSSGKDMRIFCSMKCLGKYGTRSGTTQSSATRTAIGLGNKGKSRSRESIANYKIAAQKRVRSPAYIANQIKARYTRPNKIETQLMKMLEGNFPSEWKYVGNGDIIIGLKCPDFTNINGKKALIELFGDYWHRNDNPNKRIQHFAKYGYDTLIIWEHELDFPDKVIEKILEWRKRL